MAQNTTGKITQDPSRNSYQPVPDGRFYTKANFFTLRNNSRENVISEQYQTDAEPGEQEVFEEMLHRRHRLNKNSVIQAPAVPGDMRSPQSMNTMNRTNYQHSEAKTKAHLHTISETNPQGNNSFYENNGQFQGMYPQPHG